MASYYLPFFYIIFLYHLYMYMVLKTFFGLFIFEIQIAQMSVGVLKIVKSHTLYIVTKSLDRNPVQSIDGSFIVHW